MNVLGWQNLYHPDYRNKRMWVRMYKVASTSLLFSAFNHGWSSLTPEQASKYPDYYLITFIRHPLDRCVSFYRDGNGRNMTFEEYVRKVLGDQFDNNPHCLPQSQLLIREPDFIGLFETLQQDYDRLQEIIGKRWPLLHKNKARADTDKTWGDFFGALPDGLKTDLTAFYEPDFARFGYDRPSY